MRNVVYATATAAALSTLSSAAGAQPRFDVYGGGQITHRSPEPVRRDWLLASSFRVHEWFDFVTEVGWYRREVVRPTYDAAGKWTGSRQATDHFFQVAAGVRGD